MADEKDLVPMHRAVAYIPKSQWRQLNAVLSLQGLSYSEWIRQLAEKLIEEEG